MTTATATRRRKASGITLDRATLFSALEAVGAAVPARSPKPILSSVLLKDGMICGSDLEIQVQTECEWTDDPVVLPYARLRSILKESAGDEVTLSVDGAACTVKVGRGEWRLPVEDAAEFPTWEPADLKPVCRIPCDQFARAIRSVVYAHDDESSRYALGAVLIEVRGSVCSVVATDGRRLACATIEHDQAVDDIDVLLPARAAAYIGRFAGEKGNAESAVQLEATRNECVATIGGTTVTARLLDGRFPRWRDVFPERPDAQVHTIAIDALWHATRAAAIVTTEQSKGVDYAFTESGLTLSGRSAESGESTVVCEVAESGSPCVVKLDPWFVDQMCKALLTLEGEPHVRVSVAGKGDAVIFTYGEDDEYRSVIMPLAHD
jgi:DNA polymerase-3 subunit beta